MTSRLAEARRDALWTDAAGVAICALPIAARPDLSAAPALATLAAVALGALGRDPSAARLALACGLGAGAAALPSGPVAGLTAALVAGGGALLGAWIGAGRGRTVTAAPADLRAEIERRAGRNRVTEGSAVDRLVDDAARVVADSVRRSVDLARDALAAQRLVVLWLDARSGDAGVVAVAPPGLRVLEIANRDPFLAALRRDRGRVSAHATAASPAVPWRAGEAPAHLLTAPLVTDGTLRGFLVAERDATARPFGDRDSDTAENAAELLLDVLVREELILDAANARSDIGLHFEAADEFNRCVTVEDVCDTARRVIERVVALDLFVVTTSQDPPPTQRVVHAAGHGLEDLVGTELREPGTWLEIATRQLEVQPFTGSCRAGDPPLLRGGLPHPELRSMRVLPLALGGDCVGALVLGSRKDGALDASVVERLRVVTQLATAALASAVAYAWAVRAATTDSMTGLTNHRTFKERAAEALARAERSGRPLSLILLDIDHFKRVNDTWGHPMGDEVIIAVADVLRSTLRRVDLGARYGGEEFAVLVEATDIGAAAALADRIRLAAAARVFESDGRTFSVTLSLGVATFGADGSRVGDLIDAADQALYAAKRGGRNQVVRFDAIRASAVE